MLVLIIVSTYLSIKDNIMYIRLKRIEAQQTGDDIEEVRKEIKKHFTKTSLEMSFVLNLFLISVIWAILQ